jgi:hypothetical protein
VPASPCCIRIPPRTFHSGTFKLFFDRLSLAWPELHVVYAVTRPSLGWRGLTGHIDSDFIRRHVADLVQPLVYVAGPTSMGKQCGVRSRCAESIIGGSSWKRSTATCLQLGTASCPLIGASALRLER